MTDAGFSLTQFTQRLAGLEIELRARPTLRHIIDTDLEHGLSALRLMGILPRDSAPVIASVSEPANVRRTRHGGNRLGAGRKKGRSNADRQRAYRRRVAALRKSSL